jgi:leucyl-tRNA synthetase
MEKSYQHQQIEKKWQKKWVSKKLFKASDKSRKPKYYLLDMFPYPSGAGLHVGHPEGYTATDIIARYKRMKGYNVLHPMGWDSFGLPAENYAIKTKIHPDKSTNTNIKTFRRQIQELGFSYDWDREISTCSVEYYRWTQWLFSFLYKNGLAYKKKAPVNWCPNCNTVLANEQVVDGRCDRCKTEVIQKELSQWFFKITDYLEKKGKTSGLLDGLKKIDWPESTKAGQTNWIGKKEGTNIHHQVEGMKIQLDTFSAYPAWLFADTFIVMAPEHPLVKELVKGTKHEKEANDFIKETRKITAQERNEDHFEKKGVFTGRYALDPFNPGARMPIWIANFALMDFGTGIIRCSAHDVRDYEFAQKYKIPLNEVVERKVESEPINAHSNEGVLKNSGPFSGKSINAELIQEMLDWIEKSKIGKRTVTYRIRDWLVSRQRYWGAPIPIVYDDQGKDYLVPDDELPVKLPTDVDFNPTGESPLVKSKKFHAAKDLKRIELKLKKKKILPADRTLVKRESDTMDTFVCSSWYFFRFMDPKNKKEFASQKLINQWGPVDLYVGGAEHTVLHLLYARFFTKALHHHGMIKFDEPFKKLRHQGLILGEDGEKMSKSRGNVINPDGIIKDYGADTLRIYEMFMGPFEQQKPWSMKGVQGVYRFLQKVWRLATEVPQTKKKPERETLKIMHQTLKKVTSDIEEFKFNTAVSQMMIFINHLQTLEKLPQAALEMLLICLYPFAPHLSEELWESLKKKSTLLEHKWPKFDARLAKEDLINLPVQVNGKLRATIQVPVDISQADALQKAKEDAHVQKYLEGVQIVKEIFVPGKIVNIVVK